MRKIIVSILAVLSVILAVVFYWLKGQGDYIPPVISFPNSEITFTEGEDKDILLKGVTAIDETDGDVSDTLVVESVIPMRDELRATVIYYAKDKSNNVGKATRTIGYLTEETKAWAELPAEQNADKQRQDAEAELKEDEKVPEKKTEENTEKSIEDKADIKNKDDIENKEDAENKQDIDNKIPEAENGNNEAQNTEDAVPQNEENNPVGDENPEEVKNEETLPEGSPRITLKTDQVEVAQGSHVNFLDYVEDITDDKDGRSWLWHQIYITGLKNLNMDIPGTYELYYTVTDSSRNVSNRAKLTVIVK